jgi:ankyrin repeat protein
MMQHKQITFLFLACCIALLLFGGGVIAQSPSSDSDRKRLEEYDHLRDQWIAGKDFRDTAIGLMAYRTKYGKSPDVDYMLASTLCRVPETIQEGYNHFRWMLGYYHFNASSRRLIKAELDAVRIKPKGPIADISFRQQAWGWVARVEGIPAIISPSAFEKAVLEGALASVKAFFVDESAERRNPLYPKPSKEDISEALQFAARRRDDEGLKILSFLLDRGADVVGEYGVMAILAASNYGNVDIVSFLIKRGVDLKSPSPYSSRLTCGESALLYAAAREDTTGVAIAQLLFENKVNLNAQRTLDGETALLAAAENGTLEMVSFLLGNGANVNVYDDTSDASTPLMLAAERVDSNGVTMVELLLNHGAKTKGLDGIKALLRAAAAGNTKGLQLLINAGIDVNAQNEFSVTALMAATEYGTTDTVKFLLSKGTKRELTNYAGKTALEIASEYGYVDIITLLK